MTLSQSPFHFASEIIKRLNQEAEAKNGKAALAVFKINSLSDPSIIEAIYHASRVGVKIHLIVRGICCLTPQIKEVSEKYYCSLDCRALLGASSYLLFLQWWTGRCLLSKCRLNAT